jgi:hypothetical protein
VCFDIHTRLSCPNRWSGSPKFIWVDCPNRWLGSLKFIWVDEFHIGSLSFTLLVEIASDLDE